MIWGAEAQEPATIEEAQDMLREAYSARRTVAFAGGGTRLGLGARPKGVQTVLSSKGLTKILEYAHSDQVVVAESGVTLSQLQAELGKNGQRLAIDPPQPEKQTLGGIIASNAFGPLRARYGSVRDLIIGVVIVRIDGVRAKGGGKVVKTVAGFDLPKLMCGSLGTLGFIAHAIFRVHPSPEATSTLTSAGLSHAEVNAACAAMRAQQLEPVALLASRTGPGKFDLSVRFEGFKRGVEQQATKASAIARLAPADDQVWTAHAAVLCGGPVRVKISTLPTALAKADAAFPQGKLDFYPLLGLGFVTGDLTAETLSAARAALSPGHVVVEEGTLDAWGPAPAAIALHKAMKNRFDPQGLIAPGRFIGGI
ncbi:MAG TPA: FAD-binding oxidoreductase [Myxococcales bacterium]|nr:FAD-binding oxidoreductase [Myxococcales bacterium]